MRDSSHVALCHVASRPDLQNRDGSFKFNNCTVYTPRPGRPADDQSANATSACCSTGPGIALGTSDGALRPKHCEKTTSEGPRNALWPSSVRRLGGASTCALENTSSRSNPSNLSGGRNSLASRPRSRSTRTAHQRSPDRCKTKCYQ